MTDHTPLPWRVEEDTDLIWGACNPDDQSTYGMGYSIVEGKAPSWKPHKPTMEEREANAAFIVKAVNNHASLVGALRFILAFYEPGQRYLDTEAWKVAEAGARKALKDAEA